MAIFTQGQLITATGVQQLEQNFAGSSAPSTVGGAGASGAVLFEW